MYPNVRAEMARNKITLEDLSKVLERTTTTISLKLNGQYPITLNEAKKIKELLSCDMSLEELFEEAT
jgi:cyanate lyase